MKTVNIKTITITTVLLFSVVIFAYQSIGEAFAADPPIYIVNNLEDKLNFREVYKSENIEWESGPPNNVKPGKTGEMVFSIKNPVDPIDIEVIYYVGSPGSDAEQVEIIFKNDLCYTDTPDDITGKIENCGSSDSDRPWQYIFSTN